MKRNHIDARAQKKIEDRWPEINSQFHHGLMIMSLTALFSDASKKNHDEVKAIFENVAKIHPVSMGLQSIDDSNSAFRLQFGNMITNNPNAQSLYPNQENIYTPSYFSFEYRTGQFIFESNRIPVLISAEHTFFNFIRRSNGILDPRDESFYESLVASLLLAQSYDKPLPAMQPMIVPHEDGAFIGNITPQYSDYYGRTRCIGNAPSAKDIQSGNFNIRDQISLDIASQDQQPFKVYNQINVRTFYDDSMLYPSLRNVRDWILETIRYPQNRKGIDAAIKSHLGLGTEFLSKSMILSAQSVLSTIKQITQSSDWQFMANKMMSNGHIIDITSGLSID
jgi:hypothetical protein